MKLQLFANLQRPPRAAIALAFLLFLLTTVHVLYSLIANPILPLSISSSTTDLSPQTNYTPSRHWNSSSPHDDLSSLITTSRTRLSDDDDEQMCDISTGEWIPNEEAPYYTNNTCWEMREQNCMKNGRPDTGFMRWRWKPDDCDIPIFDPQEFLEMVRGKAMAFVGDSIGRNQVQSLICLLSRVEYPEHISPNLPDRDFKVWKYKSYNFTLHSMWSPYLVKSSKSDPTDPKSNLFLLYLDEYDTDWTSQLNQLDYLVISAGHWFNRQLIFYENQQISGCQYCSLPNTTELSLDYGYRKALRLSLRALLENFKGLAFLRTFSPQHFEGGPWNKGGHCVRTRPYRRNETMPEAADLTIHDIQLEEFRVAKEQGMKTSLRLRLMDTTHAMLLRPDGHPGRYWHLQNGEVTLQYDCIHWCMPGPIDTWNDILLQMMKAEK